MTWLTTRYARNGLARHMLRLMTRLEIQYKFCLQAMYVRTFNNVLNDDLSRLDEGEGEKLARTVGLERRRATRQVHAFISCGYHRRHLGFLGDEGADAELAKELRERRLVMGSPVAETATAHGVRIHVANPTALGFLRAAEDLGAESSCGKPDGKGDLEVIRTCHPHWIPRDAHAEVSVGHFVSAEAALVAAQGAEKRGCKVCTYLLPPEEEIVKLKEWTAVMGWKCSSEVILASEFGDVTADEYKVWFALRGDVALENPCLPGLCKRRMHPHPIESVLEQEDVPHGRVELGQLRPIRDMDQNKDSFRPAWAGKVDSAAQLAPGGSATFGPSKSWCKIRKKVDGTKWEIWSASGVSEVSASQLTPVAAPLWVVDRAGPHPPFRVNQVELLGVAGQLVATPEGIRPLTLAEAWKAKGGGEEELVMFQAAVPNPAHVARRLESEVAPRTARALVQRAAACLGGVRSATSKARHGRRSGRIVGHRCAGRIAFEEPDSAVHPERAPKADGKPPAHGAGDKGKSCGVLNPAEFVADKYARDRAEITQDLLFGKLAPSTAGTYALGWRHWISYCRSQQASPLLVGTTHDEILAAERLTIGFITYELAVMKLAAGTVRNKVYAMRFLHLANGSGDILAQFPRIKLVLSALKRRAGAAARKLPANSDLLEAVAGHLKLGQGGRPVHPRDAAIWAHICLAYFFLLRNGEATALKPSDVRPRRDGAYVDRWGAEDEVAVLISGSKVDQLNAGCIRTQERAGGLLCPSDAVRRLVRASPWLLDEKYQGPLCSEDGIHPIRREEIQEWLRVGAAEVGTPADRVGTHSLRIGGATALYALGWSFGHIQRFGRWKSEAFHGYLWDSHGMTKGASRGMATVRPTLHAGILLQNRPQGQNASGNAPWVAAWRALPQVGGIAPGR